MPPERARRPVVLVVDDAAEIRYVLSRALERDFEVLAAADVAGALALARERGPRLVLLDVTLPDGSGVDAAAALKILDPALEIVMLTGTNDVAVARRALDNGARAYVTKPFDLEELVVEIGRLLGLKPPADDPPPWRVTA
jgi:DNA-binding response OmpR family regulator